MRRPLILLAAVAVVPLAGPAHPARATQPLAGASTFDGAHLEPVVEYWSTTDATWLGDSLYITEQAGRVLRHHDGQVDTLLDISDEVRAEYEMGLLGLVFSPDREHLYINYSAIDDHRTIVEEFPVAGDGTIEETGRRIVIEISQPEENHNGGDLVFGPDGYLYIGMGDGGGFGDPNRTAQDPSLLLGKMLRIDPTPSGSAGYTVPADNPFVDDADFAPEIWALGLRNPWRFTFDAETSDLWIADVGEGAVEEVNAVRGNDGVGAGRGLNFGWSAFEGSEGFNGGLDAAEHTPPIHEYGHDTGRCSISGGAMVRGDTALDGWYVFADYCSGEIVALLPGDNDGNDRIEVVDEVILPVVAEKPVAVIASPTGEVLVIEGPRVSRLIVEPAES